MSELKAMLKAEEKADRFFDIFKDQRNYEKLNKLSLNDLRELNSMVVEVLKRKRDSEGSDVKTSLGIGDIVNINSRKVSKDDIFEIVKLNPKTATVKNECGQLITCPYSLIEL